MPTGLKFLIANCVLLGWNIATFLFDLLDKRLLWACIAAGAVPFSIWGIHTSLRMLRNESELFMHCLRLQLMRSLMNEIASHAPDSGEDKPNQPN